MDCASAREIKKKTIFLGIVLDLHYLCLSAKVGYASTMQEKNDFSWHCARLALPLSQTKNH